MSDDTQTQFNSDDCVVPHPVQPEVLEQYLFKQSPFDGSDRIRDYVKEQSPEEKVTYLEHILSEHVLGREYEVWDVHTTGDRYWVITNPTNLYAQRFFPSADYTLTFHIGLAARIASRREAQVDNEQRERLVSSWRRWSQAAEALDYAHEAEEFQAVGMRCRECLLSLVRSIASEEMVPPGQEAPKAGDFIHWSELIADVLAGGSSAKEVRKHLKTTAKSVWQLVSWLTHASNAARLDGEIAIEATHSTLVAYGLALLRFERGIPNRCPQCNSYKISTRYLPELVTENPFVIICEACTWMNPVDEYIDGA